MAIVMAGGITGTVTVTARQSWQINRRMATATKTEIIPMVTVTETATSMGTGTARRRAIWKKGTDIPTHPRRLLRMTIRMEILITRTTAIPIRMAILITDIRILILTLMHIRMAILIMAILIPTLILILIPTRRHRVESAPSATITNPLRIKTSHCVVPCSTSSVTSFSPLV